MRRSSFQVIAGTLQDLRARLWRRPAPAFEACASCVHSIVCGIWSSILKTADVGLACRNGCNQISQCRAVAKLDAARIEAIRLIEIARQADVGMPRVFGGTDQFGR